VSEVHFYKPEIPESIWIDRGPNGGWMFRTEKLLNSVRQYVPADIVEAQTAEIKRLQDALIRASRDIQGYKDALAQVGEEE
jgi:hypothetical protein